jgi:serine/threonine protein phosphatase PrpC
MLEKIKVAYMNYRSLRLTACVGLLACANLLYWLSGGFPPWAWRFLFQVLPRIPLLWQLQGIVVLLPLIGLLCLALTLLLLWGVIIVTCIKMALYWWSDLCERRRFRKELQEAEQLAKQMVTEEMRQTVVATGTMGATEGLSEQGLRIPQTPLPVWVPNNVMVPPEMAPSAEARARSQSAVSPGLVSIQPVERVERQTQPVPTAAVAQPAFPPLARGQLRLVPHSDEEDKWDDEESDEAGEFPEIEPIQQGEPPGLEAAAGLHPGFHRRDAPNEDALFEIRGTHTTRSGLQHVGLFAVADGAGNSGFGQEASRLAIQTLSAVMVPALLSNAKVVFADLLKEGVHSANLTIYNRNRELAKTNCRPGTTLTAALVIGPTAYIANVGNSRAYLYRWQQGLTRVTHDNDPDLRLSRKGTNTTHDASRFHLNELECYLGRHTSVEVNLSTIRLCASDILLLCSDGLWGMVRDAEIEEILGTSGTHLTQMSTALVQKALNHGGADNISIILVYYPGSKE